MTGEQLYPMGLDTDFKSFFEKLGIMRAAAVITRVQILNFKDGVFDLLGFGLHSLRRLSWESLNTLLPIAVNITRKKDSFQMLSWERYLHLSSSVPVLWTTVKSRPKIIFGLIHLQTNCSKGIGCRRQ
jgi:hypothetical protein